MNSALVNLIYMISSVLFILGLKGLTHPRTAVRGNLLGGLGMLLAVVVTLVDQRIISFEMILAGLVLGALIGLVLALKIQMTAMPQLVALFNGFGGGASIMVAGAALAESALLDGGGVSLQLLVATAASGIIGALTFWGSLLAFAKLQELLSGRPLSFPGSNLVNILLTLASLVLGAWAVLEPGSIELFWIMVGVASLLGVLLVVAVGGADMPVVVAF